MNNIKYTLSKKGKFICPKCERKTFVLYLDNATGEHLHSTVGKCDRADNCGHHYTPKQYFNDNNLAFEKKPYTTPIKSISKSQHRPSYIDAELLKKSLNGYEQNILVRWLAEIVGDEATGEAIGRYFVGTSKNGGTVFWQIDTQGKIHAGKVMVYGTDGHRRKDVMPPVGWVHSVLKLRDFNLSQCFFGEHLLTDKTKPVAIVESEKTAIIASVYLPQFTWLACGGSEGLNADKCSALHGRKVVLYPDAGMFDKWSAKTKELSTICDVSVSYILERPEVEKGADISDYLVLYQPDFAEQPQPETMMEQQKEPTAQQPESLLSAFGLKEVRVHYENGKQIIERISI